ncbi:PAS domain-containing protein [Aureimonas sp. AU12]|uniref:PAS domain-containing sensor histidine kinase n=1 Tax=Aureimonas sp. AU12 TaxID=1638161 RepID=UPI000784E2EF|nr:PAS domain-containing protein [Aureimonas sp. AU12]
MREELERDLAMARAEIARLRAEIADLRDRPDQGAAIATGPDGSPAHEDAAREPFTPNPVSDRAYRMIVESIRDYAIIAMDLRGHVTVWSDTAADIFGRTVEDVVGRPIDLIFTPEDRLAGRPGEELREASQTGRAPDERWHLRADGSRFFARGTMMPLEDEGGRQIGFLKILRDRTRDEEARRDLLSSRERLQFALDAAALVGTWDWDIRGDKVFADARFAHFYGIDPDRAALGLPLEAYVAGVLPEDAAGLQNAIQTAIATGALFAHEYRTVDASGEVHWLYARGRCFTDPQGRAVRFPGAVVDVTRERQREKRQAALIRLGDEGREFGEPADYTLRALEILGETFDIERVGYATVDAAQRYATIVGEWSRPGTRPLSGQLEIGKFGRSLLEGLRTGLLVVDDITTHPATQDGAEAWARIGSRAMLNMSVVEDGRVQVILYLHCARPRHWSAEDLAFTREILNRAWAFSRRRRTEQSLVETETRLRLAHEAAEIGSFDQDFEAGTLVWDRRCRDAFGIGDDEPVSFAASFEPQLHPADRDRVLTEIDRAMDVRGTGVFDLVYRTIGRDDGKQRFVQASAQTVVADGKVVRFVGAVRDVTEEKEAEERQILLTRELQHRVKNTLAMVNALANQTLRRAANVKDGLAAFSARLIALSHAHDILTQTSWTSAPIAAVVSQSMALQGGESARVSWSGPDIRLTAKQSLALALALHELATNAAKYGALSNEEGRVLIGWHVAQRDGAQRLCFEWREVGGPRVEKPMTRGFGSRLIEQSLALEFGGSVIVAYEPTGLVCSIDADLQLDIDEEAVLSVKLDDMPQPSF